MFDHFSFLAPFYERVIPPPDVEQLRAHLQLPADGALLDIGGGTGRVSGQLRHFVGRLVVSDFSEAMLAQAERKDGLGVCRSRAEQLPFANESFERILVVDALHHFSSQVEAIADMVRVLKPKGRLVIEEPNIEHFRVKLIALGEKIALMQSHFLHPHEIQAHLERQGLVARIEKDGQFTAWIIGDKA